MIFTLFTLYLFIFGNNGFYSHKKKLDIIAVLEEDNLLLNNKIQKLAQKIKGIKDLDPLSIEYEARKIPLKKSGDVIFIIHNSEWLKDMAQKLENDYQDKIHHPREEKGFLDQYKIVIGFMISLLISLVLTVILPRNQFVNTKNKIPPLTSPKS